MADGSHSAVPEENQKKTIKVSTLSFDNYFSERISN